MTTTPTLPPADRALLDEAHGLLLEVLRLKFDLDDPEQDRDFDFFIHMLGMVEMRRHRNRPLSDDMRKATQNVMAYARGALEASKEGLH